MQFALNAESFEGLFVERREREIDSKVRICWRLRSLPETRARQFVSLLVLCNKLNGSEASVRWRCCPLALIFHTQLGCSRNFCFASNCDTVYGNLIAFSEQFAQ